MKTPCLSGILILFAICSLGNIPKGIPPKNPVAIVISSSTVKLLWEGSIKDLAYKIYRREVGLKQWTTYMVEAPTSVRRINNLKSNTAYEWKIQTIYSDSKKDTSSCIQGPSFTTFSDCDKPENLQSEVLSSAKVVLRWEYMTDKALYEVKLKEHGIDDWILYHTKSNTLMIDGLKDSTLYEWQMIAYCSGDTNSHSPVSDNAKFITNKNDDTGGDMVQLKVNNYENNSWIKSDDINYVTFYRNINESNNNTAVLTNAIGQTFSIPVYFKSTNGEIAFDINSNIPDGIYTIAYVTNMIMHSRTIMIANR